MSMMPKPLRPVDPGPNANTTMKDNYREAMKTFNEKMAQYNQQESTRLKNAPNLARQQAQQRQEAAGAELNSISDRLQRQQDAEKKKKEEERKKKLKAKEAEESGAESEVEEEQ